MKAMILSLSIMVSLFTIDRAAACSQAPAVYMQTGQIAKVLESTEFQAALAKVAGSDLFSVRIENIEFDQTINVVLNNGCVILNKYKTKGPSHPGMCPQFVGIESTILCE